MIDDADYIVNEIDNIVISARPMLIEENNSRNLWGYYLCIENQSDERITLVGKDWNITDDRGNHYNDASSGFKGEIPELEPGEYFEFTSLAPLSASNAVFYGSCKVENGQGVKNIKIPTFNLSKGDSSRVVMN